MGCISVTIGGFRASFPKTMNVCGFTPDVSMSKCNSFFCYGVIFGMYIELKSC